LVCERERAHTSCLLLYIITNDELLLWNQNYLTLNYLDWHRPSTAQSFSPQGSRHSTCLLDFINHEIMIKTQAYFLLYMVLITLKSNPSRVVLLVTAHSWTNIRSMQIHSSNVHNINISPRVNTTHDNMMINSIQIAVTISIIIPKSTVKILLIKGKKDQRSCGNR
jgi:hypothetical protein